MWVVFIAGGGAGDGGGGQFKGKQKSDVLTYLCFMVHPAYITVESVRKRALPVKKGLQC
jgi:hypothetical protein